MVDNTLLRQNAAKIRATLNEVRRTLGHFESFLELCLNRILASEPDEPPRTPALAKLTPRQRDMLRALALGMSNKSIARELSISESSVKVHCAALYKRIGVRGRAEARTQAAAIGALAHEQMTMQSLLQRQRPLRDEMREHVEAVR